MGTAPPTRRWLLIEHLGPWRPDAFAGAGFPEALSTELAMAARAAQARILLIRRPGRAPREPSSRTWALSVGGAGTVWGRWRESDDLRAAAKALERPWSDLAGNSETTADPVLLVCTHGVHDTCCAVRGRPVAAGLAERWPASTWECSHIGGDRFAANIVVLPDGVYYGNLGPIEAVQTVADHLAGRVTAAHLRGMARYPPVAQVAVGVAHAQAGPFGVDDVLVSGIQPVHADRWEVDLRLPDGGGRRMTVQTSARPPARLTCRAERATSAIAYDVVEVADLPGPG